MVTRRLWRTHSVSLRFSSKAKAGERALAEATMQPALAMTRPLPALPPFTARFGSGCSLLAPAAGLLVPAPPSPAPPSLPTSGASPA